MSVEQREALDAMLRQSALAVDGVFQAFHALLDEGAAALDRACQLLLPLLAA